MFFRYKFQCAQGLRTLRTIIKPLYKEQDINKSLSNELLSLETLYEMLLSHSQFLEVILSADGRNNTRGDGLVIFALFHSLSVTCKIVRNSIITNLVCEPFSRITVRMRQLGSLNDQNR